MIKDIKKTKIKSWLLAASIITLVSGGALTATITNADTTITAPTVLSSSPALIGAIITTNTVGDNKGGAIISGQVIYPDITVTATTVDGKTYTTTSDANNLYSVVVPGPLVPGTNITIGGFDSAGNIVVPATFYIPIITVRITTITGDSTKGYSVTGVATPNSSVTLTVGGIQYTGTADNSGNFLISLPGTVGPQATVVAVATVSGFLSNTATGITPSDPTPAPPVKPTPKSTPTPTTLKTTPTPASATPTAKTTATPVSKTTPTPKPVSISTNQHPTLPKTGDDSVKSSSISIVGVVLIGIGALWLSMKRKQKSNG